MVDQLQYASPIDLRQLPTLDVSGGDPILILRPVAPRWWFLCSLIYWIVEFCALCTLSVILIGVLDSFRPRAGFPRDINQIFIALSLGIAIWLLQIPHAAMSFQQVRKGLTPRKLWISNGCIHLNRAGNWRVSTKARDLQSIREIRLKPIKGFIGGTAGAVLIIKFGRFRQWSFRFKQNQTALATEACRHFEKHLVGDRKNAEGAVQVEISREKAGLNQ